MTSESTKIVLFTLTTMTVFLAFAIATTSAKTVNHLNTMSRRPMKLAGFKNSCNNGSTSLYYDQRAVLYSSKNQQGRSLVIDPQANAPDLPFQNYDNCAVSVCVTGIWLFYVERKYNTDPNSGMEYVFGPNNFCTNLKYVSGHVRSVRSVGSPADYRSDTLTLFRDTYFQGDAEYTFTDLRKVTLLEKSHKSLIITGSCGWTVYTGTDYQGDALCLFPPKSTDSSPLFQCDLNTVKIPYGSIRSVRKGCWAKSTCDNFNTIISRGSNNYTIY